MEIGLTMPIATNFDGAMAAINSFRSTQCRLCFYLVNNTAARRSVAASWNLGCEVLFARGVPAVIVANDDILCSPTAIDGLVGCWQETQVDLVSGVDLHESMPPEEILHYTGQPGYEFTPWPDFSFFLLPRTTWERVGRFDESFLKAYFEDDDYQARGTLLGLRFVGTTAAPFYHFGGRTAVNESNKGIDIYVSDSDFEANREYFLEKWGHEPVVGNERMRQVYYPTPFNDPTLTPRDTPRRRA
jgi:hypothetical protein